MKTSGKIAICLAEKRMKQKDLAEKLKTSRSLVSHWLNDKFEPDFKSKIKLAEAFNKPLDYFVKESFILENAQYIGDKNKNVTQVNSNSDSAKEVELLKKEIEILTLKLQLKENELLKQKLENSQKLTKKGRK